jgi:hypothetical protein
MDDPTLTHQPDAQQDHWETFAVAMELSIEGHRLIAEEIGFELKLLWRAATSRLRELMETLPRRRPSPPA